jgi:Protein of unknown function (DUF433)
MEGYHLSMKTKIVVRSHRYSILIDQPPYKQKTGAQKIDTIETLFSFPGITLKELKPQLLALSDDEKAQVIQLLSQNKPSLGRGIEKMPNVCGGSACITGTRITVWGLVEARQIGYSEADLYSQVIHHFQPPIWQMPGPTPQHLPPKLK